MRYAQIVEAYRNDEGKSRHRVLLSLGRVDRLDKDSLRRLVLGLSRYLDDGPPTDGVMLQDVREFGVAFTLHGLWRRLGLRGVLRRLQQRRAGSSRVERAVFTLVVHRLSTGREPDEAFVWLRDQAWVPGTRRVAVDHMGEASIFLEERSADVLSGVASALGVETPTRDPDTAVLEALCGMLERWMEGVTDRPYEEVRAALQRIRAVERRVGLTSVWETSVPTAEGREVLGRLALSMPPRNLPRPPSLR